MNGSKLVNEQNSKHSGSVFGVVLGPKNGLDLRGLESPDYRIIKHLRRGCAIK